MNTIRTSNQMTVAEITAADYRKADVFIRHGIDFCCGGNISVNEAARRAGIAAATLIAELDEVDKKAPLHPSEDYVSQDMHTLIDYIVNTHHRYVSEHAPIIEQLVIKVAARHGNAHPELKELEIGTLSFLEDLQLHMKKEEHVLFPAIIELEEAQTTDTSYKTDFILSAIKMMRAEHEASGDELHTFRKLTNNYTLPDGACNSYTLLFEKMKAFEADLHIHIHLENNILFPKAAQLEHQLPQ